MSVAMKPGNPGGHSQPVVDSKMHAALRQPHIGARIRHARLLKGLTLKQLADKISCSESFVSKVEHDRTMPSLAMLHRMVRALDLNVACLFQAEPFDADPVVVVHADERRSLRAGGESLGEGITLLRLIPDTVATLLEANIHVVEPGGGSEGMIQHEGEEMGYVLEGAIELEVDGKTYAVPQHSTFFFPSHLPHGYRNTSADRAAVIWINTPPTF